MDNSLKFGKVLASPLPGEEVIISGFAGSYPESDNVEEFMENLFNKVDMVSGEPRRWEHIHPEIPKRLGMLKTINKFDGGFFGIHPRQIASLSPNGRLIFEKTIEAILDAGLNPSDLAGTKTGIFAGFCYWESEVKWYFDHLNPQYWGILGNERSIVIDRIAYFLKLKGITSVADTACNSSMAAFDQAYRSIRTGQSDMAIVVGVNLCLHPNHTLQFARLGVLSKDDYCRVFDEDGTGYIRSEAAVVMFLQKAKDSHRIYARVLHAKSNSDGYKEQGITYPNGAVQKMLLEEVYTECNVNPADLSYLEAHGTGTKAGDPEEMNCADAFFTKKRKTPLLVGSVKASIGHSEPASGLCSLSKALIALETGIIPPNINIKTPRKNIPGFYENRLKIVTEKTPLQDGKGLVGVSSFGFGGSNTHVLLKWNTKTKKNQGRPLDNLPRIVCVSGRTENAVKMLLDDVVQKFDVEHIRLMHNIFRKNISNHLYRGFTVVSKSGEIKRSITFSAAHERPVYFYFGGFTKYDVNELGSDLFNLPILKNFETRLQSCLTKFQINLKKLLNNPTSTGFNETLTVFVMQAAIAEILKELEIKQKIVYGKSFGKFAAAYLENNLSLEDYINYAYVVSNLVSNEDLNNNVAKGRSQISIFDSELSESIKETIEIELENLKNKNSVIQNGTGKVQPKHQLPFKNTKGQNGTINIPKNSIIVTCGQPLKLLCKNKFCSVVSINLENGLLGILDTIGRIYELGITSQIQKLYPKIEFPVSRGTPMISSKIGWEHSRSHYVVEDYGNLEASSVSEVNQFKIASDMMEWEYLAGHCIDGRDLFPAAGYLYLAWLTVGQIKRTDIGQLRIVFENCKFSRACTTPKIRGQGDLNLIIMYQRLSGKFEIIEGDVPVVTGTIKILQEEDELKLPHPPKKDHDLMLTRRDIYKELRLRGYHYKGLFRGLTESNRQGTKGKIEWFNNWVAFIDHMLQMQILAEDTRLLFVPTSIAKITIDPFKQQNMIDEIEVKENSNPELPVDVNLDAGIIRCAGITIQGLNVSSIARRKYAGVPVLEKYEFVPNNAELSLEVAIRVILQIALENGCGLTVKITELLDDATKDFSQILSPTMLAVLEQQPLVQADITVLSANNLDLGVKVENRKLVTQTDCTLVAGSNLLTRVGVLKEALVATVQDGYLVSRESLNWNPDSLNLPSLTILNVYKTGEEQIVFARKLIENKTNETVLVQITENDTEFSWLPKLQEATRSKQSVIVYAQNEPLNGIIGLANCIRREPGCENVRAVFIMDKINFDPELQIFKNQLIKNMAINVLKDGKWGTYRHLLLSDINKIAAEHSFANSTIRGDLSSFKWIEGPLSSTNAKLNETFVKVHYSSLNFKDVMTASGKINADVITKDRREQECVQGFEFSGKTLSGRRVMGMINQGALATLLKADETLLWNVPEKWTLEQAATVPVVYGTCLYALVVIGQIKKRDSVLIHSGTGGIGQAAINLCLHMGCTVFTTVGTAEKRDFIRKNFPQISEKHIGNSRDLSFQLQVLKETKGRGVDIVLNSLAEEKLFASIHCLAKSGRFLEIGRFDLANDNQMNLWNFRNGGSYHGVMLDTLFKEPPQVKQALKDLIQSYIELGAVKPLITNVFKQNQLEQAFRFMSTGKHMGKVIIKIRDEHETRNDLKFLAMPRYCCNPDGSYIICGGLGGFGLELADWLVLRGAKNLVLTSRRGMTTGYQNYRIAIWRSYGCKISICTEDITTIAGCKALINNANALAPVIAVFNLAVILQDAILENQTPEMFKTSFGPKAVSTKILDEVTRKLCPNLKDFVVFSSVSCGRGNAGQSNYGMSNSVMERICEKRRSESLPALAIEWGAIGDVGLVAELQEEHIELAIGGTLQQSIANCIQCMDTLMRQEESCIVSSIVVAEKNSASSSDNIFDVVANMLGITDLKAVSTQSTLAELGMDSMNAVEIKQTLERDFGIFLTPAEVRNLTFASLQNFQDSEEDDSEKHKSLEENPESSKNIDIYNVLKYITDVKTLHKPILKLRSKSENGPTIFALPGVEGVANQFINLAYLLDANMYCLQYYDSKQKDTIEQMAKDLYPHVKSILQDSKTFHMVAHSTGGVVAVELVKLLEESGASGTLTCIDGSPDFVKGLLAGITKAKEERQIQKDFEDSVIEGWLRIQVKENEVVKVMDKIKSFTGLEEKLAYINSVNNSDISLVKEVLTSAIQLMKASFLYEPNFTNLSTKIRLYKPSIASLKFEAEDYGLGRFTKKQVEVKIFEGNHSTVLANQKLADDLMNSIKEN